MLTKPPQAESEAQNQDEAGKEKRLVSEAQRLRERQQYVEVSRRSEATIQSAQRTAKLEEEWCALPLTVAYVRWLTCLRFAGSLSSSCTTTTVGLGDRCVDLRKTSLICLDIYPCVYCV